MLQSSPNDIYCAKKSVKFRWKYFKLQLHDAIYRLRFYSNLLTHILSLSNSHDDVASIQKNRGDKSHRAIVALEQLQKWETKTVVVKSGFH